MRTFIDFAINQEYEEVERRGDKLMKMESLIDWDAFRPILSDLYKNTPAKAADLTLML
jgi:hypothetical protein